MFLRCSRALLFPPCLPGRALLSSLRDLAHLRCPHYPDTCVCRHLTCNTSFKVHCSCILFSAFFVGFALPPSPPVFDPDAQQIRLLGQWEEIEGYPGKSIPVGGIAYYITPPATLASVFTDPFHSVFYLTFILMSCAIFSKAWMEVSGSASLVRKAARRKTSNKFL